jgi:hypothetical protein
MNNTIKFQLKTTDIILFYSEWKALSVGVIIIYYDVAVREV